MGRLALEGMLEHTTAEEAFGWHLTCNLYPAPPLALHPMLWAAVQAYNAGEIEMDDEWDFEPIAPPHPFRVAVETFHLDAFLTRGGDS